MKSDSILEALTPLQKWGLVVKSNGYGSYSLSGKALIILFVIDQRDGLIRFDITRDGRPNHQVDIFAIIDYFNPGLVDQFLSEQVHPSITEVVKFCIKNLDERVMNAALSSDDSMWLNLHQASLRSLKKRNSDFYQHVSGQTKENTH